MNILFVYADNEKEWNTSQWRCLNPALAINLLADTSGSGSGASRALTLPFDTFVNGDGNTKQYCDWSDIVVVERLILAAAIPRFIELMALGKIVVADVDDAYKLMPKTIATYPFWHEGIIKAKDKEGNLRSAKMSNPPIEQLEWGMKLVHAVASPSPIILKDWSDFNNNLFLMPNYIPTSMYLPLKRLKQRTNDSRDTKFVIGWGGSWTHMDSWTKSGLIDALHDVCAKRKNAIIRVAGGDRRIPEAINIPTKVFPIDWVEPQKWPSVMAEWDLGLIPLSGVYDNRRSWIKTLEFTLMGIPWIGTKAAPTEELAAYGTRVKNSSYDWKSAIYSIMDHYQEAKDKVDSGLEFAMAQDIDKNIDKILSTYQEIYNKVKGEIV